ncbi:MAG: VWA domain-containing protein [Candidatus Yanofskybacteria bacterium]|nr:VWA domain-containing protein [Candidatus Yanofskybacteria bacterium]
MSYIQYWLENLYFSEPIYFSFFNLLRLLVAIIIATLILKVIYRPKKSKYSKYKLFGKDLSLIVVLAVCGLSVIALAGPRINKGVKLTPGGNIDVGFIVDHSFSTKTDDIGEKTRLYIMKASIAEFVDGGTLKQGDRVTLFIFGTHSVWRMPLSDDFNVFRSQLAEISHPSVYQEDSQLNTNMANAIEHVSKSMDKQDGFFKKSAGSTGGSWFKNNRIMFLFSDGDDNDGGNLNPGIRELNKRKIKIYSIGVGTKNGKKTVIEAYDPNDYNKTVKTTIQTGLKTQRLNEIAVKTGGELYAIDSTATVSGVQGFLKNAVNTNRTFTPRLVAFSESKNVWWEILALPGVVLLLLIIKIL